MKKIFKLFIIAMLAVCGVACTPENGEVGGENNPTKTSFVISVTDISEMGATVTVEPSTNDTYYFAVIERSTIDKYADRSGFAEVLATMIDESVLSSGKDSYTYPYGDLSPDTEYYAYAFGVTATGEITSDLFVVPFKTLYVNLGPSDNTFNVAVYNITATGATVSVTPSNSDFYYFDVLPKSNVEEFGSKMDFAIDYIFKLKNTCEAMGISFKSILSSGPESKSYDKWLEPNIEYYAFAFGVTPLCTVNTNAVTVFEFRTPEAITSSVQSSIR